MKEHDPVKALRNDVGITAALAVRGIKIFLADKMGVFFSLLAPIIILMLYLLFLGDIQIDALKAQLEGIPYEENTVSAIVDGWMIAGVMAVSCITVTFTSQNVLVKDRENGMLADFLAAPVKRGAIAASYMIFNIIVSAIICLAVLCLAFIYLAITGWYLTAADVFAAIGNTVLSIISVSVLATLASDVHKNGGSSFGFCGDTQRGNRFFDRRVYARFDFPDSHSVRYAVPAGHLFGGDIQKYFHGRRNRRIRL